MKTRAVRRLVEEVLEALSQRPGEDVIEDVFIAIEGNSEWLRTYQELKDELGKDVVNQWAGRWIAQAVGMNASVQVEARRTRLIGSYSKLDRGREGNAGA